MKINNSRPSHQSQHICSSQCGLRIPARSDSVLNIDFNTKLDAISTEEVWPDKEASSTGR